jgi:hypothetical protein
MYIKSGRFARFEVFTVVKIQFEVFWVVITCGIAVGYKYLGRPCCLHLLSEVGGNKVL